MAISAYYTKLDFTDKTSYLGWVGQWKKDYAELSEDIRQVKRERKQSYTGLRTYNFTYQWQYEVERQKLKEQAREMLAVRKDGKIKSYQLWQYAKENVK